RFAGGIDASPAVRSRHMDGIHAPLRRTESGKQRLGALECGFDGASGAGGERLNRLAVRCQEVVHPAEAGLPLMCRSSCPTVLLRSALGTTESTMPCSSKNSAV